MVAHLPELHKYNTFKHINYPKAAVIKLDAEKAKTY